MSYSPPIEESKRGERERMDKNRRGVEKKGGEEVRRRGEEVRKRSREEERVGGGTLKLEEVIAELFTPGLLLLLPFLTNPPEIPECI